MRSNDDLQRSSGRDNTPVDGAKQDGLLKRGTRARSAAHITDAPANPFGLEVSVRESVRPKQDSNPPSGVPFNDGLGATQSKGVGPIQPGNRDYREVIPPGVIGSEETFDMQLPAPQYVDTVPSYPTEQNDTRLHGAMASLRSADTATVPCYNYASFVPRSAPMPRACQDDLYLEGPGRNAADPRMQDRDSTELFPGRRELVDNCDLYGRNVAGVLHNPIGAKPPAPTMPRTNEATTRSGTFQVGRGMTRTGHGKRPPELADRPRAQHDKAPDDNTY